MKRNRDILTRRRDGVWRGEIPDDGWWYMTVTPKVICIKCKKVWRGAIGRSRDWRINRQTPVRCPHCACLTLKINGTARVPRSSNTRAWNKYIKTRRELNE